MEVEMVNTGRVFVRKILDSSLEEIIGSMLKLLLVRPPVEIRDMLFDTGGKSILFGFTFFISI